MVCQSWARHLLLFASVCVCVCDQQAWIIDEWISICIYLGKKCYESIKWLAAHLICSSRVGSNWLLRVFVWDSVGDSHTLRDTRRSIKHVWSKIGSLWKTRSEASELNLWKPHTTKQLGEIIINWLSPFKNNLVEVFWKSTLLFNSIWNLFFTLIDKTFDLIRKTLICVYAWTHLLWVFPTVWPSFVFECWLQSICFYVGSWNVLGSVLRSSSGHESWQHLSSWYYLNVFRHPL